MRVLSFTSLYPHPGQPTHGVFVENRLRHLAGTGDVDLKVVAPVPGSPLRWIAERSSGRYGRESRHGIDVWHPAAPLPPFGGMYLAPSALACAGCRAIRKLLEEGFDFDLIDAHYVYPDGAAAARLAREFGRPFAVTARGTDVSLMPGYRVPRRRILKTLAAAGHIIAVSDTLRQRMLALGVPDSKVTVLRNGVDLELFRPEDRTAARAKWNVTGFVALSIGHLIPLKGHDILIRAVTSLPEWSLLIAGDGELSTQLASLANSLGVSDRIRFLGRIAQAELISLYSAADVLVLASEREGWANVILESLACGTPVIASDIDENRDVLKDAKAGRLAPRSVAGFRDAIDAFRRSPMNREGARRFAEAHDWAPVSRGQIEVFEKILQSGRPGQGC